MALKLPVYILVPVWAVVCFTLGFLRSMSMTMPMEFQHYLTCMAVGHVIHYTKRPALHNYYQHLACGRLHARECHLIAFTTDPFRFVDFIKGNVEEYLENDAVQNADDIAGTAHVTDFEHDLDELQQEIAGAIAGQDPDGGDAGAGGGGKTKRVAGKAGKGRSILRHLGKKMGAVHVGNV